MSDPRGGRNPPPRRTEGRERRPVVVSGVDLSAYAERPCNDLPLDRYLNSRERMEELGCRERPERERPGQSAAKL